MKKWLTFFGLSFFSDKISKDGIKRGYAGVFLGLIFALVFLFCGLLAADMLPFNIRYDNSGDFKALVRNALSDTGGNRIELKVVKNKIVYGGGVIDSFLNSDDAAAYRINGYNIVVDTRPAEAFDDFQAYYLSNDGKGQEITPEEYATLSDVAKRNFDFKIRYSPNELVLTEELTAKHESFLNDNADFAQLQKNRKEMGEDEYKKQVYLLYIKTVYPDLTKYESTGGAPLLRNYYLHNYVNAGAENYLFIFDDSCAGSFKTDSGMKVKFYGFYGNFGDGVLGGTQNDADSFIKNAFSATLSLSVYVYFLNLFKLLPFIAAMPAVLALVAYCVLRLLKAEWCKSYGGCLKIVGSYLLWGAFFAGLITLICGFFLPRDGLTVATLLIFFTILLIRTVILLLTEWKSLKKSARAERADDENKLTEVHQ